MAYSLAFVPDDILVSILVFIDCVSLIRVYQCGDNRLNDRLLKSVTKFDLVYSNYVKMKFPNVVRQFTGLKSLTVRLYNNSHTPICDYDLISLPNTLTSLHVPQERPLFEIQTSSSEGLQTRVLDLSSIFPLLTSIVAPIGTFRPSESACLEWIEKLPRNLSELRMSDLSFGPEHIGALPRLLNQLEVKLKRQDDDTMTWNFSPDLRHLWIPCQLPCTSFESHLPLQLESLVITPASGTYFWTDSKLEDLPRSLRVLEGVEIRISTPSCFEGLPNGLERLVIGHAIIRTTDVVYPASLKEIHGTTSFSESESIVFISSLPSGIENVDANLLFSIPSAGWHLLPRKVKKMTIRGYAVPDAEHALSLPPSLEDVLIYKPSDQFLELLPKNITSLALGDIQLPFNPSILNSLYQLKTLELKPGVNVNIKDFANFTPKLTSLDLQKACSLQELNLRLPWASQLVTFIGRAYMPYETRSPKGDNEFIECEAEIRKTNSFESLAWWTHFPHTLTEVHIYGHTPTLYSSLIGLLPPHLTTIHIPGIFIDEDLVLSLRRLPRSIQTVDFFESVIQPGTRQHLGDIQALPPNLTRLSLKRLENKDETISLAKQLRPWLFLNALH